jgi:K+-sensing histidine kinase KdpD
MKKQTSFFFYVLGIYVVLQFTWWGFHLIQLTEEIDLMKSTVSNRVWMIVGEGMVFLLILIIGMWRIQVSIRRDRILTERQNNFLLSVTHELKTPLASTKLFLQTLLKRDLEKEKRDDLLQKTLLENQRLAEIVESILTATRLENRSFTLHREWVDLNELIQEIATQINDDLGQQWVKFEFSEHVKVETDVFMMKTVIRNLIENGRKYASDSPELVVKLLRKGEQVSVEVSDFGKGIPLEYQSEIFKKFVRVENEETRSQKGTGLGLFITAEFVKLMGGNISYRANSPSGSIFEILL